MDYGVEKYIPQREPIKMVDSIEITGENSARTSYAVKDDAFMTFGTGMLSETGLIEHIAQSASALSGYKAVAAGAEKPPVCYIGEIKNFHCYANPRVGDRLTTEIEMGVEVGGVTLLKGRTFLDGKLIADTSMKVAVSKE